MPRALDDLERHRHAHPFQCISQRLALLIRHQIVLISVHDQEWRVVLADVGDGVGPGDLVLLDGTADEQ